MMNPVRLLPIVLFASMCVAPAAAQTPPSAPPDIPAPSAPGVVPAPPAPPDLDVHVHASGLWHVTAELDLVGHELMALQAPAAAPPAAPRPPRAPAAVKLPSSPEGLYDQARRDIDRNQYERALAALERLIDAGGRRADAAMYWKAYSLSKVGRHAEALQTLAGMQTQFAASSWVGDARALEVEIRQASGQDVSADAQVSDDLKLLALQGIMRNDPDTALPVLENMLGGGSSVRVKERALFLVSRSRTPRGREVLARTARSATNPDLKRSAIRYLGMTSGAEAGETLERIYRGTDEADVKRAVLQALHFANAPEALGAIARRETDPELRRTAIRQLGALHRPEAAQTLTTIYRSDATPETRRAVIEALAMRRDAATLVALARAEADAALKTEIVRRLSAMRSPEARAYLLELLK